MRRVLVTGAAGFIGYHLTRALLGRGVAVLGVDNVNDYYAVALKEARLEELRALSGDFDFERLDLAHGERVRDLFRQHSFDGVVHLAAQAGVRYSLENPSAYIESNLVAFGHVLEGCRHHEVGHLVYASSSSVYGANRESPFRVSHGVDHPVSLYAATKKSNELMAHAYSHLYGLPTTGLRFFTVYGPWGRPDMALYLFTEAILEGRPIKLFNHGDMERDFTYVDDIIDGVLRVLDAPPSAGGEAAHAGVSHAPYRVFNIGRGRPVALRRMVRVLEESLGVEAEKQLLPMQPGDVRATHADVGAIADAVGYEPRTSLEAGVPRFVDWFREWTSRRDD